MQQFQLFQGLKPKDQPLASRRFQSSVVALDEFDETFGQTHSATEIQRLKRIRNVGILAHVDAGKTTVTERMLALCGVVRTAGCVDDGNTVTDYLPAERERGITIQSAAISFDWKWHNNSQGNDYDANDMVSIQLIDTPGHVDFSVEVNRSVAVLDGAILVIDAVAGVQAQTETVWRALTDPSLNNHERKPRVDTRDHKHEPLPCIALVNKMDKDGCNFTKAVASLKEKLPGANPIPIQIPLFRGAAEQRNFGNSLPPNIVAGTSDGLASTGDFVGVVDLIHMRAIVWPDATSVGSVAHVENCIPTVVNLLQPTTHEPIDPDCQVTQEALEARFELMEALAELDPITEEYYLNDKEPSNAELREGLRRATLARKALPVMAGAALKGKGVELLLDAVADLLPSPLDRLPPALTPLLEDNCDSAKKSADSVPERKIMLGHPLHPSLIALAFKVVHMKGRGGSGDGRVVFCRVYSGKLRDRETVHVITPPAPGEAPEKPRSERIGGMLELAGGRFDNMENGLCHSGDVCALLGLKSVVTGDTIMLASTSGNGNGKQKKKKADQLFYLSGVASPKPVLTVRLEAETSDQQGRLSDALNLLSTEDPSLIVEETESTTLLSGLGELHIEVTLDRLYREFGLEVRAGPPSVAYRETITAPVETDGLLEYDRTIGGTRLQASVHLTLTPNHCARSVETGDSCMLLSDPVVTIDDKVRAFLDVNPDLPQEELMNKHETIKALIQGALGALKRGPQKSAALANITCHIENIDAEGGAAQLKAMPGAIRAAAANAVATLLRENKAHCVTILEPTMSLEVTVPGCMVGPVVSDLTGRRGSIVDVLVGDESHSKSLIRGDVPLVEILGYANGLRSLTGGEGNFTAEYKGHSPCQVECVY